MKGFWNVWCLESNYESVGVSSAARVIFECNVSYGWDPLGFQLSKSFLFITVDKMGTLYRC